MQLTKELLALKQLLEQQHNVTLTNEQFIAMLKSVTPTVVKQ